MTKEMVHYKSWWKSAIYDGSRSEYLKQVKANEDNPTLNADLEMAANMQLIFKQYFINQWLESNGR